MLSTLNPIMHSSKPSVFAGDYQVTKAALKNYNITREKFGSTDVELPDGSMFNVKDYQYLLNNGDVGMHFVPIREYGTFKRADGKEVWASDLVDELLRDKMKIKEGDALFAFMYYIHPELNKDTIEGFAKTPKAGMGITHMGAYYGQGVTSNSPSLYHNRRWGVVGEPNKPFGYPCNVMIISMDDVDQATLNKNFLIVDKFLNEGVRFPKHYKTSTFRMVDLNTSFMFYRDWLREAHYLRTDKSWFTYCAAHKTLVATIALNLPHNRNSFMEVYGDEDGSLLFDEFREHHFTLLGEQFTKHLETDFEPLWKKEGLTAEQIRPLTFEQYTAYDKARRGGTLTDFKGFRPLAPTQATGWGPQYSADIMFDFIDAFAGFMQAGAIVCCAAIMAFCKKAISRMGITQEQFLLTSLPVMETIMRAHAMIYAPVNPDPDFEKSSYYIQTFDGLYLGFGGKKEDIPNALKHSNDFKKYDGRLDEIVDLMMRNQELPEYLAWWALGQVRRDWSVIISKTAVSPADANAWLNKEIQSLLDNARKVIVSRSNKIEFNTPPCILHMIEVGMFEKNPRIQLRSVCTVMHYAELEQRK